MNQRIEKSDTTNSPEQGFSPSFDGATRFSPAASESNAARRLNAGASVEPPKSSTNTGPAIDLDSEFARQTKIQIRRVILEITQLARQNIDPPRYFSSLLVKVCQAMNATGAAVWCCSPHANSHAVDFDDDSLPQAETPHAATPPIDGPTTGWHLVADYRVPDALVDDDDSPSESDSLLNDADIKSAAEQFDEDSQMPDADLEPVPNDLEGQLDQLERKVENALEDFDQPADSSKEACDVFGARAKIRRVNSNSPGPTADADSRHVRNAAGQFDFADLPNPLSEPFSVLPVIEPSRGLLPILQTVSTERQPVLVPPGGTRLQADRPENPLDEFLIHAPVPFDSVNGQLWIQVVQPASGGPTTQRGFLRFVAQVADLASEFLRVHRLRLLDEQQRQIETTEQMLSDVPLIENQNARVRAVVDASANIAQADHLFLLRRRPVDKRWRVEAAADLKRITSNSEAIEDLQNCANRWLNKNRSLTFSGLHFCQPDPTGDQEKNDWSELADYFGADRIAIFPIDTHRHSGRTVGDCCVLAVAIWASKVDTSTAPGTSKPTHTMPITAPQFLRTVSALRQGLSISQAQWWRKITQRATLLNSTVNPLSWRRSAQAFVAGCLVAGVGLFPVPLTVHSTGTLHPANPTRSYATTAGVVNKVYVEHGESVAVGQPMLQIESRDLNDRYENLLGQQRSSEEQLAEIESQLLRSDELTLQQRDRFESEAVLLRETIVIRQQQIDSLTAQMDQLTIRATIDGVVNAWNIQQRLANLPVRPGQLLLSLHAPENDWIVETKVTERDVSEIRNWISSGDGDQPATAEFFLASYPTQTIRGVFDSVDANLISQPADSSTQSDNVFWRLKLRTPATALPQHVDGAVAQVRFSNGTAPLAWALTRDFVLSVYTQFKMWL